MLSKIASAEGDAGQGGWQVSRAAWGAALALPWHCSHQPCRAEEPERDEPGTAAVHSRESIPGWRCGWPRGSKYLLQAPSWEDWAPSHLHLPPPKVPGS